VVGVAVDRNADVRFSVSVVPRKKEFTEDIQKERKKTDTPREGWEDGTHVRRDGFF